MRSYADEPLGLEHACVLKRAVASGKVHVDARFTRADQLEAVEIGSCSYDEFVVRFDWKNFTPAPSANVLLLLLLRHDDDHYGFNAVIEEPRWPAKRPGMMAISPCGSAFGRVYREPTGWRAVLTRPPQRGNSL